MLHSRACVWKSAWDPPRPHRPAAARIHKLRPVERLEAVSRRQKSSGTPAIQGSCKCTHSFGTISTERGSPLDKLAHKMSAGSLAHPQWGSSKLAQVLRRQQDGYSWIRREPGKLAHLLPALRINTRYMISGFPSWVMDGACVCACVRSLKVIDGIEPLAKVIAD